MASIKQIRLNSFSNEPEKVRNQYDRIMLIIEVHSKKSAKKKVIIEEFVYDSVKERLQKEGFKVNSISHNNNVITW